MSHSTRTAIFLFFAFLFILITPPVLLYAQGYRFDFKNFAIVKTGAILLEPRPAPADVYIDRKFRKRSNLVFQNIYLGNLFPKYYSVEARKDGYFTWEKNLRVSPKLVTEARNVTLFKSGDKPSIIASNAENFFAAPQREYIAVSKKNHTPELNLYFLEKAHEFTLYKGDASSTNYAILEVQWNSDASRAAVLLVCRHPTPVTSDVGCREDETRLVIVETANYLKSEKERRESYLSSDLKQISKISWNPGNAEELFFIAADKKSNLLFKYNTSNAKLYPPLLYDAAAYKISAGKIFYVSSVTKTLNSFDPNTAEIRQITFYPLFSDIAIKAGQELPEIISIPEGLVIRFGATAFKYNTGRETMTIIANTANSIRLSGDEKKIMLIGRRDIAVKLLENVHIQPFRDAGETIRAVENIKALRDAAWFTKNNEYIIFADENTIKIAELDTRDKQNIYTIAGNVRAEKLYYDERSNTLYFISEDTLFERDL